MTESSHALGACVPILLRSGAAVPRAPNRWDLLTWKRKAGTLTEIHNPAAKSSTTFNPPSTSEVAQISGQPAGSVERGARGRCCVDEEGPHRGQVIHYEEEKQCLDRRSNKVSILATNKSSSFPK
ncbi:hypothetical protein CEXT_302901 [Caerostris extrusa]|uniref:Uncharacterized protein n=1 Tax=Caerostris extrusa TaxID=172846 RepID=A0AAV4V484_CAEEX|nr:hypothetical protein CEXT_302901 [Caerostris extrusa]